MDSGGWQAMHLLPLQRFFDRKIEKLKKLFFICTQRYDVGHSGTFAKLRGVSVKISLYAKFLVPPPPLLKSPVYCVYHNFVISLWRGACT
jgi:hypothetical protein